MVLSRSCVEVFIFQTEQKAKDWEAFFMTSDAIRYEPTLNSGKSARFGHELCRSLGRRTLPHAHADAKVPQPTNGSPNYRAAETILPGKNKTTSRASSATDSMTRGELAFVGLPEPRLSAAYDAAHVPGGFTNCVMPPQG